MEECSEFFWKIPDFLNRRKEENKFIVSPEFTIIDTNGKLAKFQIYLNPNGNKKSKYVSVLKIAQLKLVLTDSAYQVQKMNMKSVHPKFWRKGLGDG